MHHYRDRWAELDSLHGRTVVLAMSGGVDSSAAAVLLQSRGARILGLTMKNFCYSEVEASTNTSCCSLAHMLDARRVCEQLGIEHFLLDTTQLFGRQVMDPFVSEYESGRTPNPCVDCNQSVRFPLLLAKAREFGADFIATGHYARLVTDAERRSFVGRGEDVAKDQSYFLHGVPELCLESTLFPLGAMTKSAVRDVARAAGLAVAEKSESQEICFLPQGGRDVFLAARAQPRAGVIRTVDGRELGRHNGIGNFTVGQRRGLQVAVGKPLYVQQIEPDTATVVVGDEDSLWRSRIELDRFWLRAERPGAALAVQLRYRSPPAAIATLERHDAGARVVFAEAQRAVAPGQAAVVYDDDVVVGGGRIVAACD